MKEEQTVLSDEENELDEDFFEEDDIVIEKPERKKQKKENREKIKIKLAGEEDERHEKKKGNGLKILFIAVLVLLVASVLAGGYFYTQWQSADRQIQKITSEAKVKEKESEDTAALYRNYMIWQDIEITGLRNRLNKVQKTFSTLKKYEDILGADNRIDSFLNRKDSAAVAENRKVSDIIKTAAEENSKKISFSKGENTGLLSRENSIVRCDGHIETYYSSKYYAHRYAAAFKADTNGVYRDRKGFVVTASSELKTGSFVTTSHGTGRVYDTNSSQGVIRVYTNW